MSFSVAMLKQMQEEGLSLDACIRVLEADGPDNAMEKRRAYDRQRKAAKRAEALSGGKSGGNPPDPSPNERDILTPTHKTPEPNGSGAKAGICFPADWVVPAPADLSPKARACAEQWTQASYETEAEGFALYWRQTRKRRPDWTGTWAAWVIRQHSKVMRDQKFGNAPGASVSRITDARTVAQNKRSLAELYDRTGRRDEAAELRREASQLEQRSAA